MKYALIGCGRIATNHVNAVINNGLEFVAACDLISEAIETLLAKHGLENDKTIARYTDYKQMLAEHPDIDIVAIATDSGVDAEITLWNFADESEEDNKNKGLQEQTSNVYGNGHTSLYADVINAIKNDRAPYVDAVAGRNAVEMILAIYKSAATGEPVKLPLKDVASTDFKGRFGR